MIPFPRSVWNSAVSDTSVVVSVVVCVEAAAVVSVATNDHVSDQAIERLQKRKRVAAAVGDTELGVDTDPVIGQPGEVRTSKRTKKITIPPPRATRSSAKRGGGTAKRGGVSVRNKNAVSKKTTEAGKAKGRTKQTGKACKPAKKKTKRKNPATRSKEKSVSIARDPSTPSVAAVDKTVVSPAESVLVSATKRAPMLSPNGKGCRTAPRKLSDGMDQNCETHQSCDSALWCKVKLDDCKGVDGRFGTMMCSGSCQKTVGEGASITNGYGVDGGFLYCLGCEAVSFCSLCFWEKKCVYEAMSMMNMV